MVDAMIRGEIAIAPLVTNLAIPLAAQGAQLKWFFAPEGVPVTVFCADIPKGAGPTNPVWYLNFTANPEGQVQVRGELFAARARTATAASTSRRSRPGIERRSGSESWTVIGTRPQRYRQ
jgi:hypothetical protein